MTGAQWNISHFSLHLTRQAYVEWKRQKSECGGKSEGMQADRRPCCSFKAAGPRIKRGWEPRTDSGKELSLFTGQRERAPRKEVVEVMEKRA